MSPTTKNRLAISCFALLLQACASGGPFGADQTDDAAPASKAAKSGQAVARVNGENITLDELDDWIKEDLYQQEVANKSPGEVYEVRRDALNRMVGEAALEYEAKSRGVTVEQMVTADVAALGPVTDAQVESFWQQNRAQIQTDEPFEKLAPQIRVHLEREQARQVVDQLVRSSDQQIFLQPPRAQIPATGPSMGPANAAVTIVEFSDFECPFCSRAEPTMKQLVKRYPQQVRVVYRHLPLEFHKQAMGAAMASVCADQQGKFWAYHDLLFANQKRLGREQFEKFADDLELDRAQFDQCMVSKSAADVIKADVADARGAGVTGTPAFFVNGIFVSGARPIADFVELIEAELESLPES